MNTPATKRLLIRLSSLGDVVLAAAALETPAGETHFLTSAAYGELLEGHPKLQRLWTFDRKSGFFGWLKLGKRLWNEHSARPFDAVIDLHSSLRTRILRLQWQVLSLLSRKPLPGWTRLQKPRRARLMKFLFKGLVKTPLTPWTREFARLAGGTGDEKPDLSHLAKGSNAKWPDGFPEPLRTQKYFCVMPASRWRGKEYPAEQFADLLRRLTRLEIFRNDYGTPVVLGAKSDRASHAVLQTYKSPAGPAVSGIGRWSLAESARVLAGARAILSVDTGLAHLAEAVGTRAWMIFGPTTPELGFGPWRRESLAVASDLWCRPCSKDGRACFRIFDRYACLKRLRAEYVYDKITEEC
jgi:heptosyltransferase-2